MRDSTSRRIAIAMVATLMLAACSGATATTSPVSGGASGSMAAAPAPASASASTSAPTATPSKAPGIDLSTLAGNWVGSIVNVRLNDARGDFAGGKISVAGAQIELTYAGGRSFEYGVVGPVTIKNCRPDICAVEAGNRPPWLMMASGTGGVVMHGPFTPEDTCGAPAVPAAGVATITPDRNKISFVTGGLHLSGGTCAAGSWHVVWTQVLTKAP